ncbi:MAG TPA: GDSL-type esterase/lipase family protein [Candidatus Methylacidiphilales bacterium]|jgi:lysophospholipase L1-like esterase|nr:GDSL-type esterase/lipase family protein [Candidatus Methylacidiphilales bacterium]
MKTVVCFGASLTAGTVSFNYLDLLEARPSLAEFRFLNHGVNGDLAWNGLQRLDRVIAERPDFVAILIGTNDVNATMSERNLLRYKALNHLPSEPTLAWYESNLAEIVGRLKRETSAALALLSLAVIGEDLEHEANRKIALYNEAIRRVAREENIACLPLHERMVAYLREHEEERAQLPPRLNYRDGLHNTGNALALHTAGLSWDEVSRRNGLLVTTDGLHLNSVGAGMIADLIEAWLVQEGQSQG